MNDYIKNQEEIHRVRGTRDRCADSHKAADDKRNKSTWKACDDTGLMGCCCRHDSAIYLANISDGGENRKYPLAILNQVLSNVNSRRDVRVLYDIGCNLKKFISLRHLFPEDTNRLTFGTSVFHSYVHNWKCQLEFSPRYNDGWGLSDGEGLERLWSYLSPLVSPLRYATRNHRLAALAHKIHFHNKRGIENLIHWLGHKYNKAISRKQESTSKLNSLYRLINLFASPRASYNLQFFADQWNDQRQFQLNHTDADRERQEQLAGFLDREASLNRLRARVNEMASANVDTYDNIFQSLLDIASSMEQQREFAREFPGEHDILIGQDAPRRRLQLLLWHSKSELYTHAVELFAERQPLYRGTHIGTTLSTRIIAAIERRKSPIETAIRKYNEYRHEYLSLLSPDEDQPNIPEMTYRTFVNLSLDDAFWQDVYLYHSQAPWAVNSDVRSGIHAMLITKRVEEEIGMIQHEFESALSWAVNHHVAIKAKISILENFLSEAELSEDDEEVEANDTAGGILTSISLGDCGNSVKAELSLYILKNHLTKHEALLNTWSADALSLWEQLYGNGPQTHEWFRLISTLASTEAVHTMGTEHPEQEVINDDEGVEIDEEGEEVDPGELLNHLHVN
ncbi:uncharacterized protein PGTG_10868 [Puccinia graminis f. sp. tritici CRL 75-36-700-3]|uniref:CxC1-like cysteine cluster associated with KDZ transposases domain-containing protein n=1 Tax=Puccinia graminis f. sp. tritici (strain CRL 75-36-700-3 / race SCCL) TaxID=418459 RepID=E3KK84_PUCGT|nr:uncharacterized protein PGTG_10868 [Puccinia graminis f. sp. tritici CRL 75-36-700-3]EFP84709.2 hypothetical protein PGTG_10868 [Puccinia graminis f. sp. tritici CRL 75-36-700-3]